MISGIITFLMSPIGRLVAVALIAFSIGATGAWRTANKLSDARWYKAQSIAQKARIAQLEQQIKAVKDAAKSDQDRALTAEWEHSQAEEKANALQARITDGVCFTPDDTDRLRELWQPAGSGKGRRAPRRPG